jgi:DNA-binding transcriptional LysR family regulator
MDQPSPAQWPSGVSPHALEVFRAVCQAGSQERVARDTRVSPSAVSRQMHDLERALQLRLFDRVGRRLRLTQAGEEVLRCAEELLQAAGALGTYAQGLRGGRSGRLRVAGSITVGSYWLPERLGAFLADRPDVRLELDQGPTFDLYEGLRRGRFDLVVAPGRDLPADLERTVLGRASVVLVAAPGLRPSGRARAAWLAEQPYICAPSGTRGRAMFDAMLVDHGVRTRTVVAEVGHPEGVKALARAGRGLAMAFTWSVQHEIARGDLVTVAAHPSWEVPIQAFTRARQERPRLLRELIEELGG